MALEQTIQPHETASTTVKVSIDSVIFKFDDTQNSDISVDNFIYAYANVSLYDQNHTSTGNKIIMLTKEELADWGANDAFVLELVKAKLNLS